MLLFAVLYTTFFFYIIFKQLSTYRRLNRAKSVDLDADQQLSKDLSKIPLKPDTMPKNKSVDVAEEESGSNDSREELNFSRSDSNRRSKRSLKSEKSAKSTKASLNLPLEVNKLSSGDSSQSTPTKQFHMNRVFNSFQEASEPPPSAPLTHQDFDGGNKKKPVPLKICFGIFLGMHIIKKSYFCKVF